MDMNAQIDDLKTVGSPDTVQLPLTGNVLSLPHPELGEMFAGYAWRVHRQCHWPDAADCRGELMFDASAILDAAGGQTVDHWPEAADRFFNHDAYLTDSQRAQLEQAKAQWAKAMSNLGQPQPSGANPSAGHGKHKGHTSNAPAASPAPSTPAASGTGDIPISNES